MGRRERSSEDLPRATLARKKPYGVLIAGAGDAGRGAHSVSLCALAGGGGGDECAVRSVPRAGRRLDAILDHGGGAAAADGTHAIRVLGDRNDFAGGHELSRSGWFAQHFTLSIAFLLLGAIYGGGVVAALRVRSLSLGAGKTPTRGGLVAQASACGVCLLREQKQTPQAEACATKLH